MGADAEALGYRVQGERHDIGRRGRDVHMVGREGRMGRNGGEQGTSIVSSVLSVVGGGSQRRVAGS